MTPCRSECLESRDQEGHGSAFRAGSPDSSEDDPDAGSVLTLSECRGRLRFSGGPVTRQLTVPRRVDFIVLSSYETESTNAGAVRLIMDVRAPLRDSTSRGRGHRRARRDSDHLLRNLQARGPSRSRPAFCSRNPNGPSKVESTTSASTIPDEWGRGLLRTPEIGIAACPIGVLDLRVEASRAGALSRPSGLEAGLEATRRR